jgi:hypothetical protein
MPPPVCLLKELVRCCDESGGFFRTSEECLDASMASEHPATGVPLLHEQRTPSGGDEMLRKSMTEWTGDGPHRKRLSNHRERVFARALAEEGTTSELGGDEWTHVY